MKHSMKFKQRLLSAVLALMLMVSAIPTALAANETFSVEGMNSVPTISIANSGGYALKNDGSLWTWSYGWAYADAVNYPGVTGANIEGPPYNTNSDYVRVTNELGLKANGELWGFGSRFPDSPAASNGIKLADNIALIDEHVAGATEIYALNTKGELIQWTVDYNEDFSTRMKTTFSTAPVVVLTDVIHYQMSSTTCRALRADGTLWSIDKTGNQTKELDNVAAFSSYGSKATTLAIKTDGTLWAWGDNTYGQVGNGGKYTSSEPQYQDYGPYYNQDTPVKILDNVIYVEAGLSSFAITSDGTLYGWGSNEYNELGFTGGNHVLDRGYMQTTCQTTPKVVTTNAAAVATTSWTTVVLKRDGSLWSCGSNSSGAAGQSTAKYSGVTYLVETLTKMMDNVALPDGMVTSGTTPPTQPSTPSSDSAFSDTAGHWANEYISRAFENGLVNGVGNNKFEPDSTVSNAAWSQMILNLYEPERNALGGGTAVKWYYGALDFTDRSGILNGTVMSNTGIDRTMPGTYKDEVATAAINRYDMAMTIYNIANNANYGFTLTVNTTGISSNIADYRNIPSNYRTAVEFCYAAGFITGVDSNGTFAGDSTMTRGAAAAVLCRLLDVEMTGGTTEITPVTPDDTTTPGDTSTPSTPTTPTISIDDYRQQVFELTNEERAKVGAAALNYNSELSVIAQARAEALAELGSLPSDHVIPGMGSVNASLNAYGFRCTYAGENCTIATTPSGAITNWLNSSGHKANMLGQLSVGSVACKWTDIGIGCAQGSNGVYYWVQIFVQ